MREPGNDEVWIGVDVGGTKVLAGVVDDAGRVLRTARGSTPGRRVDEARVEDTLTESVEAVAGGASVGGVGLAAAGLVDATGEKVVFAPHLPWVDAPVRQRLEDRWGVPVVLENDATAATHAETTYGAARGARDVVLVTLGTGIGGGLVMDGGLRRGHHGMAGEFGHMQVTPGGLPCECGGHGCWEQYCSGNALVRFVRERLGTRPTVLEDMCGGDPRLVTGPMVTSAAEDGDLLAHEAFEVVGDWLGIGLANLVAAFDPECLVVGGGVSAAGERLLGPARDALARTILGRGHRAVPPVLAAELGPEAGLIGAADLARQPRR